MAEIVTIYMNADYIDHSMCHVTCQWYCVKIVWLQYTHHVDIFTPQAEIESVYKSDPKTKMLMLIIMLNPEPETIKICLDCNSSARVVDGPVTVCKKWIVLGPS